MSFARATLGNIGSTLIGNVLAMAAAILTARVLGPEQKGVYVVAFLVPALAVQILSLGLGSANAYFIARGRRDAGAALGTTLLITLPLSAACTLAIEVAILTGAWSSAATPYVALAAITTVPAMGFAISRHTLLGLQQFDRYNLLNLLDRGLLVAFLAAGALLPGAGLFRFSVLSAAASFLSFFAAFVAVRRAAAGRLSFSAGYAREALHYGLRGYVGWLAELLNYRLDMLFVQALAGPLALGLYSAAVSLAETLWVVPTCVSVVMLPKLASGRSDTAWLTARITRLTFAMSVLGAAALAIVAPFVLPALFGESFRPALAPLLLLLPGVAGYAVFRTVGADFAARDRPGLGSAISWIALGATVVLDVKLIPIYGAAGAAVASTVAYLACMLLAIASYRRLTGTPVSGLLLARVQDVREALISLRALWRQGAFPGRDAEGRAL